MAAAAPWSDRLNPPLPRITATDPLTQDQWTTLVSIADTFIPAIRVNEHDVSSKTALGLSSDDYVKALQSIKQHSQAADDVAGEFLAEPASSVPGFKDALMRRVAVYLHTQGQKDIAFVLSALK